MNLMRLLVRDKERVVIEPDDRLDVESFAFVQPLFGGKSAMEIGSYRRLFGEGLIVDREEDGRPVFHPDPAARRRA